MADVLAAGVGVAAAAAADCDGDCVVAAAAAAQVSLGNRSCEAAAGDSLWSYLVRREELAKVVDCTHRRCWHVMPQASPWRCGWMPLLPARYVANRRITVVMMIIMIIMICYAQLLCM